MIVDYTASHLKLHGLADALHSLRLQGHHKEGEFSVKVALELVDVSKKM
jgi:hypothetical protein